MNLSYSPNLEPLPGTHAQPIGAIAAVDWRSIAIFVVLAIVQLIAISQHTTWRDEHQAWLIALESSNLRELLTNLRYEGHPPLWHAVLTGVQSLSTDLRALQVLQSFIALAILALLTFAAPLPPTLRLALGLNYFVIFEYGVFARSYGLGVLLIFAALALWRRWSSWLLLGAASFISLHFIGLAGAIGLWRFSQGTGPVRSRVLGLSFVASCGLLSLVLLWPAADVVPSMHGGIGLATVMRSLAYSGGVLWPIMPHSGWFFEDWWLEFLPIACFSAAGLWIVIWNVTKDSLVARGLVLGFLVGLLVISVTTFQIYTRHSGLVFVLLIAVTWSRAIDRHSPGTTFKWVSVWLAGMGLTAIVLMAGQTFSGGHVAAQWIKANGLAERTWAAYPGWHGIDFAAVNRRPTLNLQRGCLDTYQRWVYPASQLLTDDVETTRLLAAVKSSGGTLHLMTSEPLPALLGSTGLTVERMFAAPADRVLDRVVLYKLSLPAMMLSQSSVGFPNCPR